MSQKDDSISRQAAMDAVTKYRTKYDLRDLLADLEVMPSAQPDLSEYSDKLWRTAYERGKAEGYEQGRTDGIKLCLNEIGLDFERVFSGKGRREDG